MKPHDESIYTSDTAAPKTLWEAIRLILEQSQEPIALHEIVRAVGDSPYPGNPTRLRVRSVLRRQSLFNHVIETETHFYHLPKA
jgi:hypothetical protein